MNIFRVLSKDQANFYYNYNFIVFTTATKTTRISGFLKSSLNFFSEKNVIIMVALTNWAIKVTN